MDSVKADLGLLREIVAGLDEPARARARELLGRLEHALDRGQTEAERQRDALARHETLIELLGRKDTEHRVLFDAIPGMIWVKDRENRILRCNRAAAETAGATVSEMEGRHTADFYPDEAERYWQDDQAVITSGQPKLGIVEPHQTGSGRKIWVRTDKIPYRDDEDRVIGVLVFATDISELKRTEEDRDRVLALERSARADAEAANRVKEEFLAALSHELRTPLTSILGYAELLSEGGLTDDARARALASIVRNARVQVQMVEDLLNTSRIISGGVELQPVKIDLHQAIAQAVEITRPLAEAKQVALAVRFDCATGIVRADPKRLEQMLWNLVSNAIKFTPSGGHVEVVVSREAGRTRIAVRDDGEGIAPEALPFVFDRFWQAERGVTRRHGGLGIGLTLVKHLVEAHGGAVHAESDGVGKGSTFTLDIPFQMFDDALAAGGVPARSCSGIRVLVIGEDDDTRSCVKLALGRVGALVQSARSQAEALQLAATGPLDVLLCDLGSSDLDGGQLLSRMRAERTQRFLAVAVAAQAGPADARRALTAGFEMCLTKPLEAAHVAMAITSALEARPPAEELKRSG